VIAYDELRPILASRLQTESRAHWIARLTAAGVPCGSVRTVREVFEDPQIAAREMIAGLEHAAIGRISVLGIPVKLSETPGALRAAPPTLGAHTSAVLEHDLGLQLPEIDRLRKLNVV
jgi:crotonobetainyl-CoA:carnitine CoA-transferase CaiB-like acyl-CoA transferase